MEGSSLVVFLWPLRCLFFFGRFSLAIVLSVLLFIDYYYPFGIFKLFLYQVTTLFGGVFSN
jgi:hypothetical protein